MKKVVSLCLAAVLAAGILAGCGSGGTSEENTELRPHHKQRAFPVWCLQIRNPQPIWIVPLDGMAGILPVMVLQKHYSIWTKK